MQKLLDVLMCLANQVRPYEPLIIVLGVILTTITLVLTWCFRNRPYKRELDVSVRMISNAPNLIKEMQEIYNLFQNAQNNTLHSHKYNLSHRIWTVSVTNPGYHDAFVAEAGIIYKDNCCGESKRLCADDIANYQGGMKLNAGSREDKDVKYKARDIQSRPLKIIGCYVVDRTGKETIRKQRLTIKL